MTITEEPVDKPLEWDALSADDKRLADVQTYVAIEYINSDIVDRKLRWRQCEEVVFAKGRSEKASIKPTDGKTSGQMKLPAGISATIFKGYYSLN